jgi:acyl-CoA thioester hydrolase
MKIDFVKPARIDDLIDVTVNVANAGRVSFTLDQSAYRGEELIAAASVKVACLNAATFVPVPIPGLLLENIHA